MKNILFFFFVIFASTNLSAQISILSGGKDIATSTTQYKPDTMTMTIKSDLSTSNTNSKRSIENIDLFVKRNNLIVLVAMTFTGEERPLEIRIERKTSAPLAEFRLINTLSEDELDSLFINGKCLLKDEFPESRKLDSYYRIKYKIDNKITKVIPPVLLEEQSAHSDGLLGEHGSEGEDLFIVHEDTVTYNYKDFGINMEAYREGTIVKVDFELSDEALAAGKWVLERKTSESLSTYRKIKNIDGDILLAINSTKEYMYTDKYPAPQKVASYYRLKYTREKDGEIIELPAIEIPRARN